MNSIDLLLLDLIRVAEAPVYSAYRWLGRELGRELSMGEFCRLLARLIHDDIIRLWAVDPATHERMRLIEIPRDLQRRYAEIPDLEESFDPFGLSLTLGPAADPGAIPEWEVDFDFEDRQFVVIAAPHAVKSAEAQIRRLFPDLDFTEDDRRVASGRVRIAGSVTDRPTPRGRS